MVVDGLERAGLDERRAGAAGDVDRVFVAVAGLVARAPFFNDAPEILLFVVKAKDGEKRIPRRGFAGQLVGEEVKLILSDSFDLHCLSFSLILSSELAGCLTAIRGTKIDGVGNMFADTEQSIRDEV